MRTPLICIGLFASAALAACGGGSSTPTTPTTPSAPATPATPTNRAPAINSFNVAPGFGISELSSFTFNASASDPDGDPVTFVWDLAGTAASGSNGTITFAGAGSAVVRLTISDGKGATATDTRTITIGSATGTWRGTGVSLGSFTMVLSQSSAKVVGTYNDASFGNGQIDPAQPGAINAAGHIEMRMKQGRFTDFTFKGDMDQSGRRIVGQIFGSGFNGQAFTMDKQ